METCFFIPTAFTPDNDGLNDALKITGRQVRLLEIWIYNRWGGRSTTATTWTRRGWVT